MRLIDEIEAAAKSGPLPGGSTGDQIICRQVAQSLVQCDYWPRIKAALEAGEVLVNASDHQTNMQGCDICNAVARFRAAAGEGS